LGCRCRKGRTIRVVKHSWYCSVFHIKYEKLLYTGGNNMLFTIAEYKQRVQKTKERMQAQGIDVLLITDPANMNYLTGFDAWSFYVHQLVIVMLEKDEPIWIGRRLDASAAKITTWLSHKNIIPYPDNYVQSTERHPMDFVAQLLSDKGQDAKIIAAEFDEYYFTANNYLHLIKFLLNETFVIGTSLVNCIRIIKSDQEMMLIKRAANIVTNAMNIGIEKIQEGVRECDVVADIYHAQISGTEDYGGDYTSIVPLLPSGENT